MRPRQLVLIGGFVFVVICVVSVLRLAPAGTNLSELRTPSFPNHGSKPAPPAPLPPEPPSPPSRDPQPRPAPAGEHPIHYLVAQAESGHNAALARQSRTLADAVAEYRRRYGVAPPPNFDRWFEFARAKGVQLIDEFDGIHEALTPFWGLRPATVRARAAEALGFDGNALLGIQVRGGKITNVRGGSDWQREATAAMMGKFVRWLPDMDLCFNLHDEPRVVVPHEDLSRLVDRARRVAMPAAAARPSPRNAFSERPRGLNDGTRFEESKLTRFNVFAHQPTWTHSRLSCPPESPARGLEEDEKRDDVSRYGLGELGFVYNVTAMTDVCNSPSLSATFGFFDRPNAYNVVHDLFPIFSQSKISSYADILYPSPWYWFEKVSYDEARDVPWANKADALYWRGSTTGGFSRNGGWRRQHRQRFVRKINAADGAKIIVDRGAEAGKGGQPRWEAKAVPRGDYRNLVDVHFSGVGQCDPGDCDAQREFFDVRGHAEQQDAWRFRHLVDLDGNAFSGRFYAFLRSHSLVYKWAVFREWHAEWLRPWAHYVPLSLRGDDWLEAVRYFSEGGAGGTREAERLAEQQRDWANKVLRHEDMEIWFFRLLLEYGRIVDDDREIIGFSLPGTANTAVEAKVKAAPGTHAAAPSVAPAAEDKKEAPEP
ncbi:glycosyltransferase family 90 protein [Durotheca rogersii]|uniref:glycosyltransferase family 90 protein n=1 Tax=Durotheca rogersii TaxID=419775 RepID=UPI00221F0D79|nr:glycosyltransferase family 90 protein [Durotheca rogersii]KAI5867977.1 glycosyltransferase family 90 protein [Durotheca rogersii]